MILLQTVPRSIDLEKLENELIDAAKEEYQVIWTNFAESISRVALSNKSFQPPDESMMVRQYILNRSKTLEI